MTDRFHGMALFVAVVDSGSMSAAAERLQLSPPAVSRALAALEERLGTRLLQRTTRRLHLTDAGTRYLEDCRRILADLQEAEDALSSEQNAPQGYLSLTAPVLFGQLYVQPVLLYFLDLYPAVQARALLVDRVVDLVEEGLDLAVRLGPLGDSSLIARPVGGTRRVVCAAPAYLEQRGCPRHPAELAQHRLVTSGGAEWEFRDHSLKVRPTLAVTSNLAAIDAAVSGWGITCIPSYQVAQIIESGRLQVLLEEFEPEPWPIHVLHQPRRNLSLKVRLLAEMLIERLRAHPHLSGAGL
jgi:DNA-binding transcriptional LysR family regulator